MPAMFGTWGYAAGSSGTETIPAGARVLQIAVHSGSAAATMTIFGGDAVPVVEDAAPMVLNFKHQLLMSGNNARTAGSQNIVFTNTDSYFVEYVLAGNVAP